MSSTSHMTRASIEEMMMLIKKQNKSVKMETPTLSYDLETNQEKLLKKITSKATRYQHLRAS